MTRRGIGSTGAWRQPGARWPFLLALAALLVAAPPARGAKDVPFLGGRVNDLANIVPREVRERIEAKLADLEQRTGAQIAVLTVESLEGDSIEDFAVRVFQTWKLGRKDVNDGVLFVVARQERRMRIERTEAGFTIDAGELGALLGLAAEDVRRMMRKGGITTRTERGEGVDAGRYRLSFFSPDRRLQLVVDEAGEVLQRSRVPRVARRGPA